MKHKLLIGLFSGIALALVGCPVLVGRMIRRGFSTRTA
jgi:hypothetical protein